MPKRYPVEQRERAVRMALDRLSEYSTPYACAQALGPKLGGGVETLRKWLVQAQVDAGERRGATSEELEEIRQLKASGRVGLPGPGGAGLGGRPTHLPGLAGRQRRSVAARRG